MGSSAPAHNHKELLPRKRLQTPPATMLGCWGLWRAVTGAASAHSEHCWHMGRVFWEGWHGQACACSSSCLPLTGRGWSRQAMPYHGARSRQAMLCHRSVNKRLLSSPSCSPWVSCCSVCNATGNVVGHAMSSTRSSPAPKPGVHHRRMHRDIREQLRSFSLSTVSMITLKTTS